MIPPIQGTLIPDLAPLQPAITKQPEGAFLDTLKSAIKEADKLGTDASQQVTSLLSGTGGDVHSAMIAVEKADLSFQMIMQVRNKIVQAYQEVSRMPF